MSKSYLEFRGVTKKFPGVVALNNVNMEIRKGEVYGLVGENGAGKSTLLKILSGAYIPTTGSIIIDGVEKQFQSTRDALDEGISVIYQELNLVPEMTVAENLMLGHLPKNRFGMLDFTSMNKIAQKEMQYVLENIDPRKKIKKYAIAQRQMIEIAKALLKNADIIAFDEPTSSLSDKEIKRLFQIIDHLRQQGKAIIYVSHRMEEIFKVCDRVTVFRDGKLVETFSDVKSISHNQLVKKMVGREIKDVYGYKPRKQGETLLKVEQLLGTGITHKADFTVKAGEIVGFFGLVGAGRTELMRLIYGAEKIDSGKIHVENASVSCKSPQDAINHGLCYCPEDRKDEGIIPIRSVSENINISCRRNMLRRIFFLDKEKERANAEHFIEKLTIKTPSINQLIANLSGGNQQKTILARWLSEDIKVFLMDEPTRGIDVGSKYEIYQIMYNLAESGKAVVFVSSDLPEVMGVADRIIVMREGEIVGSINRDEATEEKLLSLALPVA
ncbi:MAG: L-arabinose ABC transporter ATP-binding protein AraG [Spirochaetia bacterium]|nr:L-arabinose ABC transporter ATP-binding protein AraG [Spirochaetia bacterium]